MQDTLDRFSVGGPHDQVVQALKEAEKAIQEAYMLLGWAKRVLPDLTLTRRIRVRTASNAALTKWASLSGAPHDRLLAGTVPLTVRMRQRYNPIGSVCALKARALFHGNLG